MVTIDVYYARRKHDGAIIVKAWDKRDSMYPVFYNNQYIGYTLTEVKQLVRERLRKIYGSIACRWHDQGNA